MTTVFFVRHGETDWNREQRFQGSLDIPLNDQGRLQARHLAQAWDRPADLLVASPLGRARETAEILGQTLGLVLDHTDRRLRERAYGQAEGVTLGERKQKWPDGQVPGMETMEVVRSRSRSFLHEVIQAYPGRRVIAVSHGGLINAVLSLVTGGELGTGKTLLANASVSTLVYDEGRWTVREAGRTYPSPSVSP
jgi:uncharacterized phosphatase